MRSDFLDFLHQTRAEDLPDRALELGRRWVLDLAGVAAAGSQSPLSRIICDHAVAHFGAGAKQAPMLLDGRVVSPAGAALAGGMTIDSVDGHDGHKLTKGHVGCGLFPALMAVTVAEGRTCDRDFLASIVIGYEIGTRAGIALHRSVADYHTSGAWIAVTAAAVAARTMGLDQARTREAIGIAEFHGPRSQMMRVIDHPTMLKDGSGWGAMAGVSAAYLAADGFTGAPAITVEAPELSDLWADLGQTWRIEEQYFKAFPICRWAQPAVQAVLDLRSQHGVVAEDVERIEVNTFHESLRLATRRPETTEQAQYSTAYPTAVAMVRGRVAPEDVADGAFADPEIRRLADTMRIAESEAYNDAFPAHRMSDVALVLKDGRRLESGCTTPFGDPETPLADDVVRKKFQAWAAPVVGAGRAELLEHAVGGLGGGGGLQDLVTLLHEPPEAGPTDAA